MLKNRLFLLLATLFLFSGCAERGYVLTSTPATHTITAQMSSDIRDTTKSTKDELSKMKAAVKKELKTKRVKKQRQKYAQRQAQRAKLTRIREKQRKAAQKVKEVQDAKALKEKEQQTLQTQRAKALEEKRVEKVRLQKQKEIEALKAKKKEAEAKALEKQLALEKEQRELKKRKELEAENLLEAKKLQEAEALKKKIDEKKRKEAESLKQKQLQALQKKKTETITVYNPSFSQSLRFKRINKTYQKFGTSELHGHVIYLDHAGQEIDLAQKKVYLLPVGAKINHWYTNYYLKNKGQNLAPTAVSYLNSTTLDLNKNFNFFGVPAGTYYIVIESLYPRSLKKVYIAKKINVGKYKKVMAVFSKKL